MNLDIKLPKPHPKQLEVIKSLSRFKVMMAGRRFGKSVISQNIAIESALKGQKIAYITPTYQLGKMFFKEICKQLPEKVYRKNESDLLIDFVTGGNIRFYTGERLDAMRGTKYHLVIIDEASYIGNLEEGWNNSIRPTLTDYKGRAIFLSTPRGKNYFYSLFMRGGEPGWESFKFTTYDNPYIDPSEVDAARAQLPGVVFAQEYMADPMENAANPFGSEFIMACTKEVKGTAAYYGIDLAKSVDWTVIVGMDKNGAAVYYDRFQKDWMQTKETILRLPKNLPIVIDSTGVGDAIVEELQKKFTQMHGFKFTSVSKQQLLESLSNAIQTKTISYPDGPIRQELEVFEYTFTPTGVRYSAPQGFHDDCVIALALANKCRLDHKLVGKYHVI